MKLAVIADIHGNSDALRAVLADIALEGVDLVINLGDHFSGPLDARGTAELLVGSDMLSIRGNHDRWLLEQRIDEMGRPIASPRQSWTIGTGTGSPNCRHSCNLPMKESSPATVRPIAT